MNQTPVPVLDRDSWGVVVEYRGVVHGKGQWLSACVYCGPSATLPAHYREDEHPSLDDRTIFQITERLGSVTRSHRWSFTDLDIKTMGRDALWEHVRYAYCHQTDKG